MVDKVELDFDFTELNVSKTLTLIHMLYRETDNEGSYSQPIPASDSKMPPYLQLFLASIYGTVHPE
jgi:site-specific DNA recombinase